MSKIKAPSGAEAFIGRCSPAKCETLLRPMHPGGCRVELGFVSLLCTKLTHSSSQSVETASERGKFPSNRQQPRSRGGSREAAFQLLIPLDFAPSLWDQPALGRRAWRDDFKGLGSHKWPDDESRSPNGTLVSISHAC